jgi:hypothetical protein
MNTDFSTEYPRVSVVNKESTDERGLGADERGFSTEYPRPSAGHPRSSAVRKNNPQMKRIFN